MPPWPSTISESIPKLGGSEGPAVESGTDRSDNHDSKAFRDTFSSISAVVLRIMSHSCTKLYKSQKNLHQPATFVVYVSTSIMAEISKGKDVRGRTPSIENRPHFLRLEFVVVHGRYTGYLMTPPSEWFMI